jgi:hypothetical protein
VMNLNVDKDNYILTTIIIKYNLNFKKKYKNLFFEVYEF